MAQQHFPANREIEMALLALQVFQVLFLWVHDWIPLGRSTVSKRYAANIRDGVSSQCAHSKRTVDHVAPEKDSTAWNRVELLDRQGDRPRRGSSS
jgi:hypothetical protein